MTLREIIEQHPEWLDLPVAVYRSDGEYDYVGGSGTVYRHNTDEELEYDGEAVDAVVFAGN
jgi:hypothetical protein